MSALVFPPWSRTTIGFVWLLASLSSPAQEPPSAGLTLAAALQRVAEENPALAAERQGARAAEALVTQAGYRPNPTLDVSLENFAGTGGSRGFEGLEATVKANQLIERGGKRAKRVALAARERDMAVEEFAVRRMEVLTATTLAYLEALAAQEHLVHAKEPLVLAREIVAAVEVRASEGMASPAESARARAAVAAAEAEHARAESRLMGKRAALAAFWGGSAAEMPALAASFQVPESLPEESFLRDRLSAHPRLGLQQAIIDRQHASLELQQAKAVQDISVGAGLRFLGEGSDAAWVAGFSMPLPFRNRNEGNIRAARETLVGAELAARAAEMELNAAFADAWHQLKAAHAANHHLRASALPATEEAYTLVRRAYGEGFVALIDVLDAQRALIDVHHELLENGFAYASALARVEALTDPTFPATRSLLASP